MKNLSSSCEIIYKEVIVIGNGPSGIVLSSLLSGLEPHLISHDHPDEMLSARLKTSLNRKYQHHKQHSLVEQPMLLAHLAVGLEGRTTNPVSLLIDALEHPCADLGEEMPPLIRWQRHPEHQIDHLVLGKGPPGGSWHTMDPNVLTLSLGSWMALPGLPYKSPVDTTDSQRRASAGSVAHYYKNYVQNMHLNEHFQSGVTVTAVEPIQNTNIKQHQDQQQQSLNKNSCISNTTTSVVDSVVTQKENKCSSLLNAINFIRSRTKCHRSKPKRARNGETNLTKLHELIERKSGISTSSSLRCQHIPYNNNIHENKQERPRWLIHCNDATYSCSFLVLANGASDKPNHLGLSAETEALPWVLHDLRTLEGYLEAMETSERQLCDPVLVVGAGLSAADAVIATRFRGVPVLHVFRSKTVHLDKQLPENMYPEYHKVHQMMLDGGNTYSLYTALPEHCIKSIDSDTKTVTLTGKSGASSTYRVSFVIILIGSRPNLDFLPKCFNIGVDKTQPIDAKSNPIDIDVFTHAVRGYEGLYALGPLVGDNFVRFIPGGALAVVADINRHRNW